MIAAKRGVSRHFTGLSAQLLVLTIFFVIVAEVLIYAPSIERYRLVYMEERIAAAHLASLAMLAPPGDPLSEGLLNEILDHARSFGVVLRRPESKAFIFGRNMPPGIAATYDLREGEFFPLIWQAFEVLTRDGPRFIRVTVSAAVEDDTLRVDVADTGPGLTAKARDRLFQPFSGSVRAGGTGLGLAIARELMRGHGGDIVLSETGEAGTTFLLFLPLGPLVRKGYLSSDPALGG